MKFNFFKIKKKLEVQVDEYLSWKDKLSPFSAERQKIILNDFTQKISLKDIESVTLEDLKSYFARSSKLKGRYACIQDLRAVRGLFSYFWYKKQTNIKARQISDLGIIDEARQSVGVNDTISPMTRLKPGKPFNRQLALKVKNLKELEGLSFRAIGRALNKDVKSVHRWYSTLKNEDSLSK